MIMADSSPAATDPGAKASDLLRDVDFGEGYWWGDGMEALDEKHIMMLDPRWLKQFKEEEQKEAFFHDILPILTLRFDKGNPYKERVKAMKDRENNWKYLFLPRGFDMKKALEEYEDESSTPLEQLLKLHDFVVIERAKVMYEKLWVRCSEAYFLGLAHYMLHSKMPLGPSGRVFQKRKKGIPGTMDAAKDRLSPAMVASLDVYKAEAIVPIDNIESKGKEKLITNHSNALGEKKGYITLSVMLQEVSPKFLALKARYEKGETILGKPKLTYDRRSQFKILSGGNSKTQNWKGHAVMDEVWRIYQEGPCGIGNRGYTLPQTSQWLGLCPRIRNFCVNAGIIDPVEDPLNNIWQLREYIMGKKMFGTAEMLDKITELQKDNDRQQKIIASLSFRYLLEKLSPAGRGGAAMRWQMFWDAIWKEARDGHSKNPKLRDLVEAYDEKPLYLDQLNQHAKLMYPIQPVPNDF